ncbi:hypothetical protein GCM10027299_10040 [Larkinella ripae]
MSWQKTGRTGTFAGNIDRMESSKTSISAPDPLQLEYCRTENQRRTTALTTYQQEISQLLALLDDVLAQYNHPNLRHRAIDYHQRLGQLKSWFSRLRSDLICETCAPHTPLPCQAVRFSRTIPLPAQFASLSDEFARTKAGCYQFLSVMVQLNLL